MPDGSVQLSDSVRMSVQSEANPYFFGGSFRLRGGAGLYTNALPSIYNDARQRLLYAIHHHPQNSLWQGASAGIRIGRWIETPS